MVKTFEELNENVLDKKKIDTLFLMLSRYVVDAYKQFKWVVEKFDSKGGMIKTGANNYFLNIELEEARYNDEEGLVCRFHIWNNKRYDQSTNVKQSFPIKNDATPKELGKLAKTIFQWIKKQMEKIPD